MATKREQILAAAKAALTGVTGVADSKVFRSRTVAIMKKDFPALVISPASDVADNPNIHRLQWNMTFRVDVLWREEIPDQEADLAVKDVHEKLMTNAPLLALVSGLLPVSVEWQSYEADVTLGVITMSFLASYQTDLNTI